FHDRIPMKLLFLRRLPEYLVCRRRRRRQRWPPSKNGGTATMRLETLAPDVLMFVGDDHESVATAFLDGDDALLVDSLGSEGDAQWLRRVLCDEMGATVRIIAATHSMSDHMAGLPLFPGALTIAHRHHRHAFLSQNRRVDAW